MAQEVTLEGQVIDAVTQKPLRAITVVLKDQENRIIAFKATDAQGYFKLTTVKDIANGYIEINHLSYKKQRIRKQTDDSDGSIYYFTRRGAAEK
ncbi:carboxypeptidase-like regulatory domain-containing protein [Sphingobacterium rhinopitheci]|nr:carboxypeptidase-like regulatory domain-containing protein [Sphingobacterium rhinopitheci]